MLSRPEILRAADEAEARAETLDREALALRQYAAELRKLAEKAPEGLRTVNIGGKVNANMVSEHRVAISRGIKSGDAFLTKIRSVKPVGFTLRSLATELDIPASLLSMYRAEGGRPIPRKRAERIEELTGWAASKANWPNGFS